MKRIPLLVCVLLVAAILDLRVLGQSTNDLQVFVDTVNAAWQQRAYTNIAQAIDSRLSANSNDVLALSTKMYYFVFAANNLTNARSAADTFYSAAQLSTNPAVLAIAGDMKQEITQIPLGESGAFNQQQEDQLHTAFPEEFPMIGKCLNVGQKVQLEQ